MIGWEKDHIENERSLADIKYVYSFFIVYNIVSTNTNKTSVYSLTFYTKIPIIQD